MASLNKLLYDIRRIAEHREKLTDEKIKQIYRSLMDDLSAFVGKQYVKYADEEGRLYVSYLDAKNARAKFLQEIVENVDNITPDVQAEIVRLVNETYEKSYKGMSDALLKADTAEKFEDISKDISVNPNVLREAVNNNISKLTLPAVLEKHRNEVIYQIQQELNIGLMRGDRYEKMTKRISERVGVSYSKAKNIVRTETHRNVESGFMDCAEHIQDVMDGSEYIYAATWRTMKDERVRPQVRRKTKKGWKTTYSKNGANHMKMEGVTVKAGELFDLGNGVKAKAPSQSGVAAHDCQCRCFLEYNLMTVEEFAKATGMTEDRVRERYINHNKSAESLMLSAIDTTIDREYTVVEDIDSVKFSIERIKSELGTSRVDLSGIKNDSVLSEFITATSKVQKKHGQHYNAIVTDKNMIGKSIIAEVTPGRELHINPDYFNSAEKMSDVIMDFANRRIIPKDAKSVEYIAKHEYMHLITKDDIDDIKSFARTLFRRMKPNEFICKNSKYDVYEFVADYLSTDIPNNVTRRLKQYYGIEE